ncbi:MAG: type II toxin-antitoxin system VapC family toxin [Deltaproteobacteria bacterium]|nr:type II toxin-antitoxin system VapC family toxin [Deltaproteobacteria bacterium]MBI3388148.1 type II toxin-antitoxin system VapC family toxin [Deltaproteobacteria bacterium]
MIVVDTNVLAYHWLPGRRASATEALARLDMEWAAPLLWRSEFRNVLAGYIRSGRLSVAEAERAVRHAASSLLGGEHVVADEAVLGLVTRSKCSAYDCEFVALADALNTVLVTDDKALLAAFPKLCRSLDDAIQGRLPS